MKNLLFILMASALLLSCSNDFTEKIVVPPIDNPVEIRLMSQTVSVTARTPFIGGISQSNPLLAMVPASMTSADYSSPYGGDHKYMKFSDNGTTAVGFVNTDGMTPSPKYYPSDNSNVYLCGLYPHNSWSEISSTATASIDGKTDLMIAKEITVSKASQSQTLVFEHLLTKLDIKIQAEDATAIATWGNVTAVKLKNVKTDTPAGSVTVGLGTGIATFQTGSQSITCYQWNTAYTDSGFSSQALTTTATNAAYVLCQPVTTAGNSVSEYTLTVSTINHSAEVEVPISLQGADGQELSDTDTSGQAFTVTLTFKSTQIEAKVSVTDWVSGGTASGEIL